MFDIGFWEISLIFVVGLLILGPERMPQVARTAGLFLGRARAAMRKLQREVQRELMVEETRAAVEAARKLYDDHMRPAEPGQRQVPEQPDASGVEPERPSSPGESAAQGIEPERHNDSKAS